MKIHYRSIFISDFHLGSRGAQAEALSDFLKHNHSENLYCIGDCIDLWALKRSVYFPISHQTVIRQILKRATSGTKVFYAPGNHDEHVRDFIPLKIENIEVQNEFVHTTADGRAFLIVHGDCYDAVVQYARWVAFLGDIGYTILLRSNTYVNMIRKWLGYEYWSLSAYVKARVKSAVSFIGEYEKAVVHSVQNGGYDGVICGHIHHAECREMNGVLYMNTGDWVETCSALVEHMDGRVELIYWNVAVPEKLAA